MRLPVSTPRRLKTDEISVKSGVVGDFVLPAAPEDPQPGAAQHPDRVRMLEPSGPGVEIDLAGPRMGVAGGVREGGDSVSQALVAGPAKGGDLALARLPRHRR